MKKLPFIIMLIIVSFFLTMCKKGDTGATGPAGPAGPTGPQGPTGIAGNANVTQYTYGDANLATSSIISFAVTTTADTMNQSAWFVYLLYSTNVYPMPGSGYNGYSVYRNYWYYSGSKANFVVVRTSGTGEDYTGARIIRIYANTSTTGGRLADKLPDINFSDYHAVCSYYGLKE